MNYAHPKLRTGNLKDITLLIPVIKRALERRDGTQYNNEVLFDHVLMRMKRFGATTDIAVVNNQVVGFAISHPLLDNQLQASSTDTLHLALLMVDPDHWGKQIASQLIDHIKDRSRSTNKRRITLYTLKNNNERAQNLYSRHGFTVTGAEKMSDNGILIQYEYFV